MSAQQIIEIKLGGNEVIRFDEDVLTSKAVRQLRLDVQKVMDDYDKDITARQDKGAELGEALNKKLQRVEGESDQEFEERTKPLLDEYMVEMAKLTPDSDTYWLQDIAFGCLQLLADLSGQSYKLTRENFDGAPWMALKKKLAKLLLEYGCEVGTLFLPPRLSEEN